MKRYIRKFISMILVLTIFITNTYTVFAQADSLRWKSTAGDVISFEQEVTWAEAGRQLAGMLSYIVEDAADIDLEIYSERIQNLSLEDDSIYLAILAEAGYLPEEPAQIDPDASITAEEYVQWMELAFPAVVDSQTAIDSLQGESDLSNIVIMGDNLSITTMVSDRLAAAAAQQLSLTAVKASALSLNAASSVDLSGCEIARVHINDTAVKESESDEEEKSDLIYLHMDSNTQLPEVIVKSADEVIIEGSGALGVVRVQEAVKALTVRATGSVVNETEEAFEVTGPDAQTVELQPGEQVDFVLSSWLVSFVTEGTPVETQEVAPGSMVDFSKTNTTLEGKVFTAWYEDAAYTIPVSRLEAVNRQMTLYARFIDESEAAIVTFETFGGRELEPMVFAKGEYLLTKPVESLYTSKEGYSFGGWCVDEECTTSFGYTDPIEESMTLYAMYSSYEQEVQEDLGTVAELELADGTETIGLVLPEGMTAAEAKENITVEAGTGGEAPEIAVRENGDGAELYCEEGFVPATSFTLYAENGVQFAGYPEYIDTLTVSVFREEIEVVEFVDGLNYVLWDEVTEYTPVSKTDVEYTTNYSEDGTVYNMLEENDAEGDVIPGKLVMNGEVNFQPEQIVVFYDGEIGRDEATITAWEGGDLAGYVLFAKISSVENKEDGTSEVTFLYADPEEYMDELDVHTTEEVNLEENLSEEQIEQIETAIASQLSNNDELKAQMLVAVMTSEDTQQMLDDQYGAGSYSLAALVPYMSNPKMDINLSVKDSTATAGIGVGVTVDLYGPQGLLVSLSPYLFFEEQLTLDINVDGGFLWVDMSVLFNTKTTVSLQLEATTGDNMEILSEAKTTLEEIVNPDGTATEDYDYQQAADTLMNTMKELVDAELEYQDLFAVPLLKLKYSYYGIITVGINVELVGQAAVVATFGITVTAEYGQKIGFNYNFKKFKGGSYKEKLGSEVTTEVYLIGKVGVRVGIGVTLYLKLLQNVTVSISGSVYAYIELAGMFLYSYALSSGGGNDAGAIHMEVGIDIEIELCLEVELLFIAVEKEWTLWSHRWPLYSLSRGMTMSVIQHKELEEMWAKTTMDADAKTSYTLPYIPMKTYNMLTAECTENQLLFENLQKGNVTAKLTLENIIIDGETVNADDPRAGAIYVGDGKDGKLGAVYVDELTAAAQKVTNYECDVVLTYENKNKSELIKKHRQVFQLSREFKMATTTVNVDIVLYDWCAHAWGIEAAEWDNAAVFETSFENTHVLGSPVEPTATGEIDLASVIAAVQEQYPDIDVSTLSWFNPAFNEVDRTVQYSIPRISNMCYLTPKSNTMRYDIFATTTEYDLTFHLFANRYPGYTGEITYIIEAPEVPADTEFTVSGSDEAEVMTFVPVEEEENRWSLTAARSAFDGTERLIMMSLNGGEAVASGLTVTGREPEAEVILELGNLEKKLSVTYGEGIEYWEIRTHDPSKMDAITPGEKVTLFAKLKEGYAGLRLTSEPEGLNYTTNGSEVTFTMPSHDVLVILNGVRSYQVNFQYNYGELGTYSSTEVQEDHVIEKPADPYVKGLTFAGWYDNAACEGEPYDFTKQVKDNVTLYADWRVNVTVDFGGASGQALYVAGRRYEEIDGEKVEIIDSKPVFPGNENEFSQFTYSTQKLGDTALEIVLPNYDGYDFMGWYLTSDFSGEPVDPVKYELTEGVTFYACWKKIAVLTYELNYGEEEEPYAMTMEHVGMQLEHIPPVPQREHYEFLGWFRMPGGEAVSQIKLEEYIVESTMTLYACWKPTEYAVTYELSGGENASENPAFHTIESDRLPLYAPSRTGYHFLGWNVSGIDELEMSKEDGGIYIPAASVGEITLTAEWDPVIYTISYDLIRGETPETNPVEYTVESGEIVLSNPTADGYEFIGWTGTDLTEPTLNVVIPAGSVGDRSYKAKWLTNDPIGRIVELALEAVPDSTSMNLSDFTGAQDIESFAMDLLSKDDNCADYIDQLSVSAEQLYDADQDGTSYFYTIKVTVTFTDDSGATVSESKELELKVLKNPVEISANVIYPEGSSYIPYGMTLADVELTDCAAVSNGENITGTFLWADTNVAVRSANNGQEVYKVEFIPDDTDNYSTAETLIVVNTQIGLCLQLDIVPDTIEYMRRGLNPNDSSECSYYVTDNDTGVRIDSVTPIVSGAVIVQTMMAPGTLYAWINDIPEECQLSGEGEFDPNLYVVVAAGGVMHQDSVLVTRAKPVISGKKEYDVDFGTNLSSITIDMAANTAYEPNVLGNFAWETSVTLNTAGSFNYTVVFTPRDTDLYEVVSVPVTVNVSKYAVTLPTIASVTYNRSFQKPSLSDTDYYTVERNDGGTDAGNYTVTLKLRDTANCRWADGDESETKNLTFTIAPAPLSVSSQAEVDMLGYGEQLVGGQSLADDGGKKSASKILKKANVTITSNGAAVAGWWEWTDEEHVGRILNASSTEDSDDYGNGYSVLATFHPTSVDAKNFEILQKSFLVQVARAIPDASKCDGYIAEGAIYMPAEGDPVNPLSDFTPAVKSKPVNPITGQAVDGSLEWETKEVGANRIPGRNQTTGLAMFKPKDSKNYEDVEVKISWTYRINLSAYLKSDSKLLKRAVELEGYDNIVPAFRIADSKQQLYFISVKDDPDLGMICVYRFTVFDWNWEKKLLRTTYVRYDTETRQPNVYGLDVIGPPAIRVSTLQSDYLNKNNLCGYIVTLPGEMSDAWNRSDIRIKVDFGVIDPSTGYVTPLTSSNSYSLRNSVSAAALTDETAASIPKPGTIDDVVKIEPRKDAEKINDVWKIQLAEDQKKVGFKWDVSENASEYLVYTQKQDGTDEPKLIDTTTDRNIKLDVSDYASGCYKLYVGAVLEDGSVSWGEAQFELLAFEESSTETEQEPSTETKQEPSTETEPESSTETEPESSTETEQEPSTETKQESSTETEQEPSTETEPESSTETKTEPSTETVQEPSTEAEKEPSTETKQESSTEAEKEPTTEAVKARMSEEVQEAATEAAQETNPDSGSETVE